MFRRESYEYGSGDNILDQVEGMKLEHENEAPDLSAYKSVDQAPTDLQDAIIAYREKLRTSDLSNQDDIEELHKLEAVVKEIDPSEIEGLKKEFMAKKIE